MAGWGVAPVAGMTSRAAGMTMPGRQGDHAAVDDGEEPLYRSTATD